jgi:hypothetical protein
MSRETESGAERARRIPELEEGRYSDGHPLDDLQYLECKLTLKPEGFTSPKSFWDFGKLVRGAVEELELGFSSGGADKARPRIREVVFLDTPDRRLYNNAFILRRRIMYEDGFPVGDPEIVFKFRHPVLQKAADMDVRPRLGGGHRVKFKAEALPLKTHLGGVRMLFSHNAQFGFSQVHAADPTSMATLARLLPPLRALKRSDDERLELVSHVIVEEVLQDLGVLDFGKGVVAKANVALWRVRGDHRPLVGEFAFQVRAKRRDDVHAKALKRAEQLFVSLQHAARGWMSLGTTKTGVVYRIQGNPPQAHE